MRTHDECIVRNAIVVYWYGLVLCWRRSVYFCANAVSVPVEEIFDVAGFSCESVPIKNVARMHMRAYFRLKDRGSNGGAHSQLIDNTNAFRAMRTQTVHVSTTFTVLYVPPPKNP